MQACEMFILELTARAWSHSEENKRRTLQRNDISAAVRRTDVFDFLVRASFRAEGCRLMLCISHLWLSQVDIIPQDERDDAAPKPQAPPAQASISQPAQVLAHHPSVPAGLDPQALQVRGPKLMSMHSSTWHLSHFHLQYWPGRGSYQPQQQQQPQAQPQQVAPQLQSVQGQAARPAQPQWQVQHHSSVLHGMQQGQVQPAQTASTAAGMPRLQPMHRPTLQPPQPQVQQQQQQYQHQQQQQSAPRLMQNVAMMQPAQTQGAKP